MNPKIRNFMYNNFDPESLREFFFLSVPLQGQLNNILCMDTFMSLCNFWVLYGDSDQVCRPQNLGSVVKVTSICASQCIGSHR